MDRSLFRHSAAISGIPADATFFQDEFQGAEVRERGLEQVEPDKRGEPQPVWAVIVRQRDTGENEQTGKTTNDKMHFHERVVKLMTMGTKRKTVGIISSHGPLIRQIISILFARACLAPDRESPDSPPMSRHTFFRICSCSHRCRQDLDVSGLEFDEAAEHFRHQWVGKSSLASSSKATACSRLTVGKSAKNSANESPPSR
jgi:hypothetical protein